MVDIDLLTVSKYHAKEMFKLAGLGVADAVYELPRIDSNFLFQIKCGNKWYFLRVISPVAEKKSLFNKLMYNKEVGIYQTLYGVKGIHTPKVLYIGRNEENKIRFFVTEGYEISYQKAVPTLRERRTILFQAGVDLARTHSVKGTGFGYEKMGLENSWAIAYKKIIDRILAEATLNDIKIDAVRINQIIERAMPILEKVPSRLVHFSLDKSKIYVSKSYFNYQGIIGWETAIWGDIAGDFVSTIPYSPINNRDFRRGYASISSIDLDEELMIRINLMKLFKGLAIIIDTKAQVGLPPSKSRDITKRARIMVSQAMGYLENPFPAKD